MAFNHFDYVPSTVDVRRSVFKYRQQRVSSIYVGYLYPVTKPIKMMPGSSVSLDLAAEIRSGALIAPLTSELQADFFAFWVPNRIVWEHWKQFLGAVDDVTFNNLTSYTIPSFPFGVSAVFRNGGNSNPKATWFWNQMLACHYGVQCPISTTTGDFIGDLSKPTKAPQLNALMFRGYTFIANQFFRPEQIINPWVISKTDNGYSGDNMDSYPSSYIYGTTNEVVPYAGAANTMISGGSVLPVSRSNRDIYTSCLPNPSLETLNLLAGLIAPVGFVPQASATLANNAPVGLASGDTVVTGTFKNITASSFTGNPDIYADLNQTFLTVNNYRETIMLQNYYDALNRAGSRYDEIIRNIFHVNTSSALVDIPQLIIHKRFTIYRKEIVASTDYDDGAGNIQFLGQQAGYIDTVVKDNYVTFSSVEHGYLHLLMCVRNARIVQTSGIDPDFRKLEKFDLYYPQFDGMGDVDEDGISVFYNYAYDNDDAINTGTLGYQEYGAHWKWQRSDAVGFVDPHLPQSIKGYVITDSWTATPSLNYSFITSLMDFVGFANCLAISSPQLAPHFIIDIRLNGTITHPMPTYNIPGQGALL